MPAAPVQVCTTTRLLLLRACSRAAAGSGARVAVAASCLHGSLWQRQPRSPRAQSLCSAAAAAAPAEAAPQLDQQPASFDAPHVSVLLTEVLAAFEGRQVRQYVDGTLGAAGHGSAMLRQHPEMQALVGFDLDPTAHQLATACLMECGATVVPVAVSSAGRAAFELPASHGSSADGSSGGGATAFLVRSNFGRMKAVLQQLPLGGGRDGIPHSSGVGSSGSSSGGVDAILLDLGISSMQVDTAERGFSFLREGPLDMRMDPGAALSAEALINSWPEAELGRVFREYGEERSWKGIARRIVAAREEEAITTTQQLVRVIGNPGGSFKGGGSKGGKGGAKYKHPATRVFQAIRIAVNGELQSIAQALPDAIDCLAPGGRLAVITFHSLEDRIVKWAFRRAAGMAPSDEQLPSYCLPFEEAQPEPSIKILTRRPIAPSEAEQQANVRSRSAKLRVVEKL